jgi:hypothetical protein
MLIDTLALGLTLTIALRLLGLLRELDGKLIDGACHGARMK